MANQEHADLLEQGVEKWNIWRREHPDIRPDLSGASPSTTDLTYFNLSGVDLSEADLHDSDIQGANLREANLDDARLQDSDLSFADLSFAHFSGARLRSANLSSSILQDTDLSVADLNGANLSEAKLNYANLSEANLNNANLAGVDFGVANITGACLSGADLSRAKLRRTILGDIDLRKVKGLETVQHEGPSTIGIDTILRSGGDIPEVFLRGAGVNDIFIKYIHSLSQKPIQYYTCFISYSSKDQNFAERLHADLQGKGVRCWFAPKDLTIGDKIRPRLDESIRLYDKLLLVLSEHSVISQWVEQEAETALEKERNEQRTVLFPIRLDNAVLEIKGGWPALIHNTRHIGDFTHWKDHDSYQLAFDRLLHNLKAEV